MIASAAAALIAAPLARAQPRMPLPRMTDGPFYPNAAWRRRETDWDADLTQVRRGAQVLSARGEHLGLTIVVADSRGTAIDGAEVEIWQCDALAAYRHPRVSVAPEQMDPGFQGFGAGRSGSGGLVTFRTIRPVPYPGRCPHIHVKLRHAGFGEISSQLFVDGDPGNARDFLWRSLDEAGQAATAMRLEPANAENGLRWQARHAIVVGA